MRPSPPPSSPLALARPLSLAAPLGLAPFVLALLTASPALAAGTSHGVDAEADVSVAADVTAQADAGADVSVDAGVTTDAEADADTDVSVDTDVTAQADADTDVETDVSVDADAETQAFAEEAELGPGVYDPRKRRAPRTHRFRLGFQMDYVRLSAAVDDAGETQRFHYLPLQLDFAYQVQLFKVLMLRPSLAIGGNPANTAEAMPAVVHPQLFGGYQGKALGIALGYGYLHPVPARKDVISDTRGGLGQPVITANHAVRGEVSYTTRVDRGALSFALRLGGLKSHIRHYDLDERKWRFFVGLNVGWYFGDGHRSAQREAERRERRRERR